MIAVDADQGVTPNFLAVMGIVAAMVVIGLIMYMVKHTAELSSLMRQIFSTSLPLPSPFAPGSLRLLTVMWFDDVSGFGLRLFLQRMVHWSYALSRRASGRRRVGFAGGSYEEWSLSPSVRGPGTSQASGSSITLTEDAPIASPQRARAALPGRRQSDSVAPAPSSSAWGLQRLALSS